MANRRKQRLLRRLRYEREKTKRFRENANAPVRVKAEPPHSTELASDGAGSGTRNNPPSVNTVSRESRQPMQIPSNFVSPLENGKQNDELNGKNSEAHLEECIDSDSIKGIFGWETVDGTSIPYLLRKKKKFVSVRIVERKLLSKYPNTFPDELGKKDPLVSHFITEAEANLLNEINTAHCDYEYGHNPFTVKDLIVDLAEFEEFFKIVKKTFPADVLAKIGGEPTSPVMSPPAKPDLSLYCGWIQINNTVSPYILRVEGEKRVKLVPLSVIIYAAGLLTNSSVDGLLPTSQECAMLNEACKTAGFDFTFGKNTRLVSISEVLRRCQVQLFDLPFKNPLQHARYLDPMTGQPSTSPLMGPVPPPLSSAAVAQHHPPPTMRSPHGNMDLPAGTQEMNPYLAGYPQAGFFPPQMSLPGGGPGVVPPGVPGYRGSTSPAMMRMPGGNAGIGMPSSRSQMMTEKKFDNDGANQQGMPGSLWSIVPRAPPPAHANNSIISTMMSKTPPITPDPPISSTYQHHSLPHNSVLYSKNAMPNPDLNHPIYRSSMAMPHRPPVSQAIQKDHPASVVRYPPPVSSMLPPPPQYSNPSAFQFGVNQFDSSLFARTDMHDQRLPGNTSTCLSSQLTSRRRSGESPKNALPRAVDSAHQNKSSRLTAPPASHAHTTANLSSARNNNHSKPDLSHKISACLVNGKSISCLNVNSPHRKGSFCLVEAVSKLYFPTVPLVEFVNVLQNVLKVSLHECSPQEETAFVQYYNLPVNKLKCNKIIKVNDLERYFPQLNYMFTKCTSESSSALNLPSTSPLTAQKRRPSSPPLGPPNKMLPAKLENVVHKLQHGQMERTSAIMAMPGEAPVIIIDDE